MALCIFVCIRDVIGRLLFYQNMKKKVLHARETQRNRRMPLERYIKTAKTWLEKY